MAHQDHPLGPPGRPSQGSQMPGTAARGVSWVQPCIAGDTHGVGMWVTSRSAPPSQHHPECTSGQNLCWSPHFLGSRLVAKGKAQLCLGLEGRGLYGSHSWAVTWGKRQERSSQCSSSARRVIPRLLPRGHRTCLRPSLLSMCLWMTMLCVELPFPP